MKNKDTKITQVAVTPVTVSDSFSSFFAFSSLPDFHFKSSGAIEAYEVAPRAVERVKHDSTWSALHSIVYVAERIPTYGCSLEHEWGDWNNYFIRIISAIQDQLGEEFASFECLHDIASRIPDQYSLKPRLEKIQSEVDASEGDALANVKSFLCMLRFVPILQEKQRNIGFYINESKRFGITLGEGVGGKSLDLLFKEDGEIYFSYMDRGEGLCRVSGSSYLTDYLSNSKKVRKIFNLFDY